MGSWLGRSALCIAVLAVLPWTLAADQARTVSEVVVAGNRAIAEDVIRKAVTLKPGDECSEAATAKDRGAVLALGSFSDVKVSRSDLPAGVKITYEVTENPTVTRIRITGSAPVPYADIRKLISAKIGEPLNSAALNRDIEAIQSHYYNQGYFALVTEKVAIDPKTGVLTVPILVHKVESVTIEGLRKHKPDEFLALMHTRTGAVFSLRTLKEDMMALYNTEQFEDIKPYKVEPGSAKGVVRVTVPVVEK